MKVTPLAISSHRTAELENNLLLFYTGIREMLHRYSGAEKQNQERQQRAIETMHEIKRIGYLVRDSLANGDTRSFGELLDLHWRTKKNLPDQVSNNRIDQLYELAMRNGALGGKIMGAGGGGFFMFYSEDGKERLRNAMSKEGLKEVRFRFDLDRSQDNLNI